jgi:geranylgeranyl reductase family protein
MSEQYDVIVAGAGMAGSLAAGIAAKGGLNVALLDRNTEEQVGKKTNWGWVCGDAVANDHLKFIKEQTGLTFSYPALDQHVDGVYAISPDLQSKYIFEGEGFVLNRPEFEKKLLDFAKKSGVNYISQFEVEGPVIENDFVTGVFGKSRTMEHKELKAKVVIDALGVATQLRRKLPENPYVDKDVDVDDLESTGRYIYDFDIDHEDPMYFDRNNALIHLNQEIAPGGYGWVFPKKGLRVNIGIGVQKRSLQIRNEKLGKKDTLHSLMDEYVRVNPVIKNPRLFNADNNGKGYWSVAVRHQMESLVYNGYMGAGDSMAMPNPISAGGIGPSLVAGVLAGQNAIRAIGNKDVSIRGLWQYNLDFNEKYGKKTAGLETFRIYLQSLNNDVLNYGMKTFLTAEEAEQLSYGLVPELHLATQFKKFLKGVSNINAFANLVFAVRKMKKLNGIYNKYPTSPDNFTEWRALVSKELEDVKERFKPNPI